jgi:hypothetical protein
MIAQCAALVNVKNPKLLLPSAASFHNHTIPMKVREILSGMPESLCSLVLRNGSNLCAHLGFIIQLQDIFAGSFGIRFDLLGILFGMGFRRHAPSMTHSRL